jgi:lysophospholipase L1-like esterase
MLLCGRGTKSTDLEEDEDTDNMPLKLRHQVTRFLLVVLLCVSGFAQQAAKSAQSDAPSKPTTGAERLQRWRLSRQPMLMDDFGELARYRDANVALPPPAAGENRVVFFGDSITDLWKLDVSFPGKPYVNRGISGQTTPQLLIRLRPDVIELRPKVVVILAGTNDIAGNTGPESLEEIEWNYASMAELARAHEIKVIYSSVLPVHEYTHEAGDMFTGRPPEKIVALNRWLKNYCASSYDGGSNCVYLDYFTAMVDDKGYLKKELADDGLHPNAAGYRIMTPLAEAAIEKAVADPAKSVR